MLEQGQEILIPILNGVGDDIDDCGNPDPNLYDSLFGFDDDEDDEVSVDTLEDVGDKSTKRRLPCKLVELQQLLQVLLCFQAWAKCSTTFDCSPKGVQTMQFAI